MDTVEASEKDALLGRIGAHRKRAHTLLMRTVPKRRRLLVVSLLGGAVATAMSTGPAFGGKAFTAWLTGALDLTSPAWQLLCGIAALSSFSATVATGLSAHTKLNERVVQAQMLYGKLERLHAGLELNQLEFPNASQAFLECVFELAQLEALQPGITS